MKPNANTTGTEFTSETTKRPDSTAEGIRVPPLMSSRGDAVAAKSGQRVDWKGTKIGGEPDNFLQKSMDRIFRR
jgi:hypothetical protein